ncbi:MAG: cytochrome b/b6 domain-containing protein [Acidobacteriota bacterium]
MIDFYAANKLLVWSLAIILPVAGCLLHYFCFGPHTVSVNQAAPVTLIRRFRIWELIGHWLILLSFMVLAVTGLMQVIPNVEHSIGPFHGWLGFIFFLVAMGTLLVWIPDALFRSVDWLWMRVMGGYLSRNSQPIPAGRFNAGQKVFYWLIMVVLIGLLVSAIIMEQGSHSPEGRKELFWCIHGLLGCLATSMVMGHVYLSLFANPDTAQVLWSGRVSRAYIDKYHALWKIRP